VGLTTSSSSDLPSSPAARLGSELIRSASEYHTKASHLDLEDDDIETLDVRDLFPKRRVISHEITSDDEDEPYNPPAPTKTYNGTHSPGSYEYNREDYEDDDSYLFEGDVFQRAGEISRRYRAGEGLYGQIDYNKRLYSDSDYTSVYHRKPENLSDEFDADYTPSYNYKSKSADYGSEPEYTPYTPAHKYRPSVAAIDAKFSSIDKLPRSRLDQSEAWMEMQSHHRAVEDKEHTSILDRIRVKVNLCQSSNE
jgi:hypothetical protein